MKLATGVAVAALLASASYASAAGNLVDNGNFSDTLNNWTASGGVVNAIEEGAYDGINGTGHNPGDVFWAAFGGGQAAGGSISQFIETVAGMTYTLSFNYGGWGDSNAQTLEYAINGVTNSVTAAVGDLTKNWSTIMNGPMVSLTFTALTNGTTLSFTDISGSSINADGVLTNVAVVAAVPGPEAGAGLAGLAMAGIGAYVLRRRRQNDTAEA